MARVFSLLLLLGVLLPATAGWAHPSIGEQFAGEKLGYEVGFWVFESVGGGWARFSRMENGNYLLYHEGKAEGVFGLLTLYRREIYRAVMTVAPDGRRLIPLLFEENSVIGSWFRRKTTVYDWAAGKATMETQKKGETTRQVVEMPPGAQYDNAVTAFYNFRGGAYGKVEPGRHFIVRTVSKKGHDTLRFSVLPREEAEKKLASEPEKEGKELLVRIFLEKDMLSSLKGEMDIWFDRDLVPVSGVVKAVRYIGDVHGRRTFRESPKLSATTKERSRVSRLIRTYR